MGEKLYGLLGRTLGHSWSVPIHQMLGCGGYRLIELEPDALPAFLARHDIGGLNVTIPYKRTVMPYCDEIDETARAIGSVNTLVREEGGKLCAYNTDADGFLFMVRRIGADFSGRKVLILGSGGASLTAQAMSRRLGAAQIVVVSRSGENNYRNLDRHADAEIIVNTTPVGMYPKTGVCPVDLRAFPACRAVLDVIYNPRRTALLMQAEELGIVCSDGLPMLAAQAVAAEERFFRRSIPISGNQRILSTLRQEKTNIVLIGMPGCGKTTVGTELSRLTGREAIDIDAAVTVRAGRSISDLFAEKGEAAFRELERAETARIGCLSGKIILTGGGVVKDQQNYAPLHQNGRIYHLERSTALLVREGRPLSQNADLSAMYQVRLPLYRRFRDAVICNDGTPADTAAAIWRDFCEHSGD